MSLHWIVPGRRAVVRQSISYGGLIRAWVTELGAARDSMCRWYPISPDRYPIAVNSIRHWLRTTFAEEGGIAVARQASLRDQVDDLGYRIAEVRARFMDRGATLDSPPVAYYVRLWKGPLRVLLEAEAQPAPLADHVANPQRIEFQHGGRLVRLVLNNNGEATNTDAFFLMGDVVEFPLFKFLGVCGLSAFGTPPLYTNRLTFNGSGSFLLGTSLKDPAGVSPPASPILHDNFVAMRFQTLLNGYLAAFSELDRPLFRDQPRDLSATDADRTVHTRGFIYSGALKLAVQEGLDHYCIDDSGWCGDAALPTVEGLGRLTDGLVVTPGGTCSPTTLFLCNYMMNHFDPFAYGADSVRSTFLPRRPLRQGRLGRQGGRRQQRDTRRRDALITTTFELIPAERVVSLADMVTPGQLLDARDRLITRIGEVLELVDGQQSFMHGGVSAAQSMPQWNAEVRQETRNRILESVNEPQPLMTIICGRLAPRSRASPGELEVLRRLHRRLFEGAVRFCLRLEDLLQWPEWSHFANVGPSFSTGVNETRRDNLRRITCLGDSCRRDHQFRSLRGLRDDLRAKRNSLERLADDNRLFSGQTQHGTLDSRHLTEVNIIALDGHEFGLLRLHPHDQLLECRELSRAGFLAAYHPLSGTPFFDDQCIGEGHLYIFEATGRLNRWERHSTSSDRSRTYSTFGSDPFKWERVDRNSFLIQVTGATVRIAEGQRRIREKPLRALIRLRGQTQAHDPLARVHDQARAFRPIYVHPSSRVPPAAKTRLVDHGAMLYAARAVPFPTMAEIADAFIPKEAVRETQRRVYQEAAEALAALQGDLPVVPPQQPPRDQGRGVRRRPTPLERLSNYVESLRD